MVDSFMDDNGRNAFDLMSVFRHLLVRLSSLSSQNDRIEFIQVDIVFKTGFDIDNGILEKWRRKEVDPLDLAVTDFPKLTLFVSIPSIYAPRF